MTFPNFIIIGAMKCGTSTLAAQLGAQDGVFMTTPKEPNFFSDNTIYAKGSEWYQQLFDKAAPTDIKGEASTHYTKLPTYPETIARMPAEMASLKLVYLIRDPIGRAVSHFIHEWSMGNITEDIEKAFNAYPELISYSCYGQQIAPYVEAFGAEQIHVTTLEALRDKPQTTLEQVSAFLDIPQLPVWQQENERENVSADRIRRFPLHGPLIDNPVAANLRRLLLPQALRNWVKTKRQMQNRPQPSQALISHLQNTFTQDRALLMSLFPNRSDLDVCYQFSSHE